MLDRSSEDDDYGSIAFLDGSTSLQPAGATLHGRPRRLPSSTRVALTAPAVTVMTDFTWDTPVTVAADRFIDDALRDMMVAGVRALLVMRGEVIVIVPPRRANIASGAGVWC
jgi:hypothetical protein